MKSILLATITMLFFISVNAQSEAKTLRWLQENLVEDNFKEVGSCEEASGWGGEPDGFTFKVTENDLTVTFSKGQITIIKWADITRVTRRINTNQSVVINLDKQLCNVPSAYKSRHLLLSVRALDEEARAIQFQKYFLRIAKLKGATIME